MNDERVWIAILANDVVTYLNPATPDAWSDVLRSLAVEHVFATIRAVPESFIRSDLLAHCYDPVNDGGYTGYPMVIRVDDEMRITSIRVLGVHNCSEV